MQRVDRRHGQHRADAEGHRRGVPHFDAGGVDRVRQFLAAEIGGRGEAVPAGGGPGGVGLLPAGRRGDLAVLERRAELVADAVERRDHVGGEFAGLLQHRIDGVLVEVAVNAVGDRGSQAGGVFEGKGDVGNRGAVCHGAQSSRAGGGSKRRAEESQNQGVKPAPGRLIGRRTAAMVRAPVRPDGIGSGSSSLMGRSQAVRQRILIPPFGGSIPPAPASY